MFIKKQTVFPPKSRPFFSKSRPFFSKSRPILAPELSLPQSVSPERGFTWVGSGLTNKHQTRLEKLARNNHVSLLQKFINYSRKNFYNIGLNCNVISQSVTLLSIISSSVLNQRIIRCNSISQSVIRYSIISVKG